MAGGGGTTYSIRIIGSFLLADFLYFNDSNSSALLLFTGLIRKDSSFLSFPSILYMESGLLVNFIFLLTVTDEGADTNSSPTNGRLSSLICVFYYYKLSIIDILLIKSSLEGELIFDSKCSGDFNLLVNLALNYSLVS